MFMTLYSAMPGRSKRKQQLEVAREAKQQKKDLKIVEEKLKIQPYIPVLFWKIWMI